MISSLTRLVLLIAGLYAFYRYRFKIMNNVLGNPWIRRVVVSTSMNIPFVRDRMMSQVFR